MTEVKTCTGCGKPQADRPVSATAYCNCDGHLADVSRNLLVRDLLSWVPMIGDGMFAEDARRRAATVLARCLERFVAVYLATHTSDSGTRPPGPPLPGEGSTVSTTTPARGSEEAGSPSGELREALITARGRLTSIIVLAANGSHVDQVAKLAREEVDAALRAHDKVALGG